MMGHLIPNTVLQHLDMKLVQRKATGKISIWISIKILLNALFLNDR